MIVLAACRSANPPMEERNPLEAPPVDSVHISLRNIDEWKYRRELPADLDGDGHPEQVVILADVEVRTDGTPLWEDGHHWTVFVEAPGDDRTLLYAAFVPNGFAEAAVLQPDDRGRRKVLVQERTPRQLRSLEIEYHGPGSARSSSAAYYQVESWMPGSASMR